MYMRFGRPSTPIVYEDIPDVLGAGVDVMRDGADISLIACGHMRSALEAAESLEQEDGVEAEVVNVSIVKPIDTETILESISKTGVAVTAEEHRVVGGLADAVRQVAAEEHPVPILPGWATSSDSRAPARLAWSTSASPRAGSPTAPARRSS